MDPHIEDLFEKAPPFSDGDLTFHPDFERCSPIADTLEYMLLECFGGGSPGLSMNTRQPGSGWSSWNSSTISVRAIWRRSGSLKSKKRA